MDLAAASAGPWLVLGVVVGLLLAGALALAVVRLRRAPDGPGQAAPVEVEAEAPPGAADGGSGSGGGWTEDDLPGFLDAPPGVRVESPPESAPVAAAGASASPVLLHATPADAPLAPARPAPLGIGRRAPAHAATDRASGRLLVVLTTIAVLLVGAASGIAAVTRDDRTTTAPATALPSARTAPTWDVPDLTPFPPRPRPGDPGAGRLAAASVPLGIDGVLVRSGFGGLVLERHAVGVTVAYPGVSLTAETVPDGPALAHVRLPAWNCLTDTAPDDPVAAGCRRVPTEYAELATPALTVTEDGAGLRISGRFATYVRPAGSPPEWTGRVYPLVVHLSPGDDGGVAGTLHLGTERADALGNGQVSEFRRGR